MPNDFSKIEMYFASVKVPFVEPTNLSNLLTKIVFYDYNGSRIWESMDCTYSGEITRYAFDIEKDSKIT